MAWASRIALILGSGTLIAGCLNLGAYTCSDNTQCRIGEEAGVCQPATSFCSYVDPTCPGTGFRYGEDAGNGLAGECVESPMATTTMEPSTTEPDESSTTESMDSSSTTGSPVTTIDPVTTGSGSSSETGDTCGSEGQPCCDDTCDDGLGCFGGTCGCVAQIAAGDNHNCIVRTDGSVLCWGDNSAGQLGVAAIAASPSPLASADLLLGPGQRAVEIDASSGHTCAAREDGQAVCWGENATGASIPGMPAVTPAPPTQISLGLDFALPAIGTGFSCFTRGATLDVVATCFGSNNVGQLTGVDTPGPVNVAAAFTFAEIDAGARHVCGRTATGETHCWGDNADGQLAVNPTTLTFSTTTRQLLVDPAADLATGRAHTCIRTSNQVQCWGDNDQGQLGDGLAMDSFSAVVAALPVAPIQSLTSGADTVCAKQADSVYCWGDNTGDKLLILGQTANDAFSPVPVLVDVLDGAGLPVIIEQIVHGSGHGCILTDTHEVMCWGLNAQGQVGNGIPSAQVFAPETIDISCR